MRLVPKHDIINHNKILFSKNESYFVEGIVVFDREKNLITYNNQKEKSYVRIGGKFIENFLIG